MWDIVYSWATWDRLEERVVGQAATQPDAERLAQVARIAPDRPVGAIVLVRPVISLRSS